MQFILLFVWIVFLIYIILGAFWGYYVTTMGEFCKEPIYNLNKQVPHSARNYTMYYTACQDTGVIEKFINKAVNEVTELNTTLTNITATAVQNNYSTYCPGNTLISDIQSLQKTLTGVVSVIENVEEETGCTSIQQIFFDVINDAWCTDMYTGIFFIWGSQLFTNFFLFLSVLVASYVWQYYGNWNGTDVDKGHHDFEQVNVDGDEEEGSEEEEGGGGVDIVANPERDTFLERDHSTDIVHDPYADPNAHVIHAQVVAIEPPLDIEMIPVRNNSPYSPTASAPSSKKKGPKKVKNNAAYNTVDDAEAQI